MNWRTELLTTAEAAITGAATLAAERVYINRTRAIEAKRSEDKPPMVCLYLPVIEWRREAGTSSRWVKTTTFELECWADVDPARASRVKGDPDRLQSAALDALSQQVVNALWKSQTFMALAPEPPNLKVEFAQDLSSQNRVAASRMTLTFVAKGVSPLDESVAYDDLKWIWTDHEIKDSPGATPDVPAISEHPDIQQSVDGLDEE